MSGCRSSPISGLMIIPTRNSVPEGGRPPPGRQAADFQRPGLGRPQHSGVLTSLLGDRRERELAGS